MELELKKEQFACYQALPQLSENREETTETIVPDYLPDIARIVDASGCLFLRSREIADGKAQVSGTVRMTLLYVAEDAQGMKSFEYTLPLDETIEGRALSGSADSCLDGRLCSCEVRMLNPRKVFTRVNVELTLTPYVPASLSVCSGVKEQEAYKIETLCEKKDIGIIRAIREKDFTFSDEVLLSGTKEPIQELLRTKCALRVTDCKSIGNKIVLKGVARLDAIYLDESGNLASMSSELPFSQILDGLAEEEGETTVRASLRLTGAEIHVGSESEPDNNRAISLRLYISAFTAVREVKSVCCVADLYSTAYDLTAKTETVELCDSAALVLREQLVREKIETGRGADGAGDGRDLQQRGRERRRRERVAARDGESARAVSRRKRRAAALRAAERGAARDRPSGQRTGAGAGHVRGRDRRVRRRGRRGAALPRNVCRQRGGNAALSLSSVA